MAEEVAIINGADNNLKPTAATRTAAAQCAQHEDSGGGDSGDEGSEHATPSIAIPIPSKRSNSNINTNNNNTNNINNSNSFTNLSKKLSNSDLQCKNKTNAATMSHKLKSNSDTEEGFLSTSPDSANGEPTTTTANTATATMMMTAAPPKPAAAICHCASPSNCVTLKNILDSFKAPLSEEQAWALIFQSVKLYRSAVDVAVNETALEAEDGAAGKYRIFSDLEIPESLTNLNVHRDGTVHCSWTEAELKEKEQKLREEQEMRRQEHAADDLDEDPEESGDDSHALVIASQKKILRKLGVIIYTALDYNLQEDEQCQMSQELEELITYMTADESDDDCIDEGIDEGYKRWDDDNDDEKFNQTKELDYVLETCKAHVKPTVPDDHYKAVCRALVTETIELRIFLQQVLNDDTETLRLKADSQTSKQELAKLGFNDWARFWVQVIEELRRGVRLKKKEYSRAPIEYELTPYEILMEDIRSKKYQLRKVMVNGDIPPRVKKDAHALILEFIRSRPPLKKASERELPPPIKRTPSPREQLMDSIRQGRTLKHIQPPPQPRLKDRLTIKKQVRSWWCI